ncbi:MAG: phosphoribosylformylglycinamidine synthase subunit PurS [Myxococcota bacterium]
MNAKKARVYVTLKAGVLDPQGRAVQQTLSRLGYPEVAGVRVGKYIELELTGEPGPDTRERVTAMCEALIANPVLEDFRVEIDE